MTRLYWSQRRALNALAFGWVPLAILAAGLWWHAYDLQCTLVWLEAHGLAEQRTYGLVIEWRITDQGAIEVCHQTPLRAEDRGR